MPLFFKETVATGQTEDYDQARVHAMFLHNERGGSLALDLYAIQSEYLHIILNLELFPFNRYRLNDKKMRLNNKLERCSDSY